jgi:hypothetical protein
MDNNVIHITTCTSLNIRVHAGSMNGVCLYIRRVHNKIVSCTQDLWIDIVSKCWFHLDRSLSESYYYLSKSISWRSQLFLHCACFVIWKGIRLTWFPLRKLVLVFGSERFYHDVDHSIDVILRLPVPFRSGFRVIKHLRPGVGCISKSEKNLGTLFKYFFF